MDGQKILLLGAKQNRLRNIRRELITSHLRCSTTRSIESADEKLRRNRYEAAFISQTAAKKQTQQFCLEIRQRDSYITLIVEIEPNNYQLEKQLLLAGVDDVIPISTKAVIAAARISIRLINRFRPKADDGVLKIGTAIVDCKNYEVWNRGETKHITPGQLELLQYFITKPGHIISRNEVCELLWTNSVVDPEGKNLDVQISKIRSIIETNPKKPMLIKTVRGVGYRFVPQQ